MYYVHRKPCYNVSDFLLSTAACEVLRASAHDKVGGPASDMAEGCEGLAKVVARYTLPNNKAVDPP